MVKWKFWKREKKISQKPREDSLVSTRKHYKEEQKEVKTRVKYPESKPKIEEKKSIFSRIFQRKKKEEVKEVKYDERKLKEKKSVLSLKHDIKIPQAESPDNFINEQRKLEEKNEYIDKYQVVPKLNFSYTKTSIKTGYVDDDTRFVYCCRAKDEFGNDKTLTISSPEKYEMGRNERKELYKNIVLKYSGYSFDTNSIKLFLVYDKLTGNRYEF